MIHPTIHSNGTSKITLREDWSAVWTACDALRKALANATPNGRDYYLQSPNGLATALDEHQQRVQAVERIATDMENLLERTL